MSLLHTLDAPVELTQDIKKSRFIARAAPVDTPAAALAWLARIADPQATHNCWAYRIGQAYRFSDDGEPGGTAGRPILQAIDGQGYDRVMVVVIRWYGGIKLGAGGLARAYGGCAAEALRTAARVPLVERRTVAFALGFAELPVLLARLRDFEAEKVAEDFGADGVRLRLALPAVHVAPLRRLLGDLSRGRATLEELD